MTKKLSNQVFLSIFRSFTKHTSLILDEKEAQIDLKNWMIKAYHNSFLQDIGSSKTRKHMHIFWAEFILLTKNSIPTNYWLLCTVLLTNTSLLFLIFIAIIFYYYTKQRIMTWCSPQYKYLIGIWLRKTTWKKLISNIACIIILMT